MVWIYGEFGGQIPAAPYLLEDMVDSLKDVEDKTEELTVPFKLQVIYLLKKAFKFLC